MLDFQRDFKRTILLKVLHLTNFSFETMVFVLLVLLLIYVSMPCCYLGFISISTYLFPHSLLLYDFSVLYSLFDVSESSWFSFEEYQSIS